MHDLSLENEEMGYTEDETPSERMSKITVSLSNANKQGDYVRSLWIRLIPLFVSSWLTQDVISIIFSFCEAPLVEKSQLREFNDYYNQVLQQMTL